LYEKKCYIAFIILNSCITWHRSVVVVNLGIRLEWFSSPIFSFICFENSLNTSGHLFYSPLTKSFLWTDSVFFPSKLTNFCLSFWWFNFMWQEKPYMIKAQISSGEIYSGIWYECAICTVSRNAWYYESYNIRQSWLDDSILLHDAFLARPSLIGIRFSNYSVTWSVLSITISL